MKKGETMIKGVRMTEGLSTLLIVIGLIIILYILFVGIPTWICELRGACLPDHGTYYDFMLGCMVDLGDGFSISYDNFVYFGH